MRPRIDDSIVSAIARLAMRVVTAAKCFIRTAQTALSQSPSLLPSSISLSLECGILLEFRGTLRDLSSDVERKTS